MVESTRSPLCFTKLFVLPVSTLRFPMGTEGYASRYLLAGGEMEYLVEQEGLILGANRGRYPGPTVEYVVPDSLTS